METKQILTELEAISQSPKFGTEDYDKCLEQNDFGLHPYDWTDRVRRVWRGISLFS